MFFYEVGYGSPEDSHRIMLMHATERFTQKQFDEIVTECFARIYVKLKKESIKHYESMDKKEREHRDSHVRVSDIIYDKEFRDSFKDFGFIIPEITRSKSFFGWVAVEEYEEGWDSYTDDEDKAFLKNIVEMTKGEVAQR